MATATALERSGAAPRAMTAEERKVIAASSLGTVFEWYDFYLYGLLATVITAQFFSGVNETTGFILALAAFAAGFAVRPFGALVFGRIGDLVGRKNTFLVTMAIMGVSTFAVGLLPSYATVGVAAPLLLVACRLLQGLALGGEYGGAATYVAEHAPEGQARVLHQLHPDHRHARPVRRAAGGDRHAHCHGRGGVRRLGLAAAVLRLVAAARGVAVDPAAAQREPGLPEDEGRGHDLEGAADRGLRPLGERPARADRAVRRGRRAGGGVVHRPVLRAVLPRADRSRSTAPRPTS